MLFISYKKTDQNFNWIEGHWASLVAQRLKHLPCNVGDLGSIPGSGRSPGEGNGNPLQDSCLENPMDGGVWWATVHGVTKSWTRLSDFTNHYSLLCSLFRMLQFRILKYEICFYSVHVFKWILEVLNTFVISSKSDIPCVLLGRDISNLQRVKNML